jgi:hypothetical protein
MDQEEIMTALREEVKGLIAGNRESSNPGIGGRTERFLVEVFRRLAER